MSEQLPEALQQLLEAFTAEIQDYGRTVAWWRYIGRLVAMGPRASTLPRDKWRGTEEEQGWYEQLCKKEEAFHTDAIAYGEARKLLLGETPLADATPEQREALGRFQVAMKAVLDEAIEKGEEEAMHWYKTENKGAPTILVDELPAPRSMAPRTGYAAAVNASRNGKREIG